MELTKREQRILDTYVRGSKVFVWLYKKAYTICMPTRFDDRGEAIITISHPDTPDGLMYLRECEIGLVVK